MEEYNIEMDQYKETLREDAEAIQTYIEELYSVRVPPPLKPTNSDLSFWKLAGIEATLFSISALGAAILSSVRTGGLFYILEEKLLTKFQLSGMVANSLSLIALITSLLAFEGFLIAHGFSKGKENNAVKISRIGLMAAFAVIMFAGVFSGFGIITLPGNWEQIFDIGLALVTAVSAGLVTYYGGENIGYSVNKVSNDRQCIMDKYQESYNTWIRKAVDSYKSSHYSLNRMGEQQEGSRNYGNEENYSRGVQTGVQTAVNEPKMKKSEHAKLCIEEFVNTNNRLPSVSELISYADISQGLSSNTINDYIYANTDYCLRQGYVDQDRVDSVVASVEKRNG
jgi:hypothetical protein